MTTEERRFPDRPVVGVGIVVLRGEDVLLIRRPLPDGTSIWSIPGGAQERGETTREAAARELREETGVTAEIGPLLDVVDLIEGTRSRPEYHYTLIDYLGIWRAGEPRAASDALEARFVPHAELGAYSLRSETLRVIRLGLARQMMEERA